jgi:nucleotidyltransferase substrate binding protein (TIGR01987 family)
MTTKDIRWIQRFHNFTKALSRLSEAVELAGQRDLSKLEEQGMIQAFEFTHELAWNTLKDFLESRGVQNIYGSKDATREAFKAGLIENGETWMDMIRSRNLTTHTYNESTALEIVEAVTDNYFGVFNALHVKLNKLKEEEQP